MLVKRERINIVEIILDLRRAPHRMKFHEIASSIGVSVDMVKGWFYDASAPRLEDGIALLALHELKSKSGISHPERQETGVKPASHARVSKKTIAKEKSMARKSQPKNLSAPGADPQTPGQSDVDAAIVAGKSGQARKIAKPKPEVAPAKVSVVDSQRPRTMPVNQKTEMSYAEAMKLHESGEQTRAILTDKGWLAPPLRTPQHAKAGVA